MDNLNQRSALFLLIAVSLVLLLWIQIPKFSDEFRVDEDFRSFYWMRKFRDPALFPNDQFRSERYVNISIPSGDVPVSLYSPGYGLLFYAASFFVTPVTFSKLLPFLLLPISVWFLFRYGQSVRNTRLGVTLAIGFVLLNLVSTTALSVTSGLQRGFATPLLIALVYTLHRRRYLLSALVAVAAALIYAPAFLLVLTTWGLSLLELDFERRPILSFSGRGLALLLLAFFLGAVMLLPVLIPQLLQTGSEADAVATEASAEAPDAASDQRLWERPDFRAGGRRSLFTIFPIVGRAGLVNKARDALHFMLLTLISGLVILVRGRQAFRLPSEVWSVLMGGLAAFSISWASILITDSLLLYMPSRFGRVSLFVFLVLFVTMNSEGFLREALLAMRLQRGKLVWLVLVFEIICLGLILFNPAERSMLNGLNLKWVLAPAALLLGILSIVALRRPAAPVPDLTRSLRSPAARVLIGIVAAAGLIAWMAYARMVARASLLDPPADERAMLAFVETLPKDSLVGGAPCALDSVPLFSGRQILFNCERPSDDAVLTQSMLNAVYADDAQTVLDFCDTYGVDFFVIHLTTYSDAYIEEGEIFYAPYNDPLLDYIADQDGFVLPQAAEELSIFESGPYRVIPCSALRTVEP